MNAKERLARLTKVLEAAKGRDILIVLTQLDPDAIGGGLAFKFLLKKGFGIDAAIGYFGAVGNQQNKSIFNLFDLGRTLKPLTPEDLSGDALVVLIDSSAVDDSRVGVTLNPRIVVDHHSGTTLVEGDKTFIWVEDTGSATTLVTELIRAKGLACEDDEDRTVFILASLGVYTDTDSLVDAGKRDLEAYAWLGKFYEQTELITLLRYRLSRYYFENLTHALTHRTIEGPRLVANAGIIRPDEGDDLAIIADLFIRMEGISLVVVWGLIHDPDRPGSDCVRLSARSTDISMSLGSFLQDRFGAGGAKLSQGGKGIGGAQFKPRLTWDGTQVRGQELLGLMGTRMEQIVFAE
ncbi:MAG: hypothetical protein AAB490_01490 [Patescibacteria group bacterium]